MKDADGLEVEPQEGIPRVKRLIRAAEKEAMAELKAAFLGSLPMGYCPSLWARQKADSAGAAHGLKPRGYVITSPAKAG